ncbi:hypothetical protein DFH09DRAFT_1114599 [Mycena vulgaris]|nr:hypothetical protein DFH09DRAFT_1114599 [Mycena vulgaris]
MFEDPSLRSGTGILGHWPERVRIELQVVDEMLGGHLIRLVLVPESSNLLLELGDPKGIVCTLRCRDSSAGSSAFNWLLDTHSIRKSGKMLFDVVLITTLGKTDPHIATPCNLFLKEICKGPRNYGVAYKEILECAQADTNSQVWPRLGTAGAVHI